MSDIPGANAREEIPESPVETVRSILRDHGFDRVGIARVEEVPGVDRFRRWLTMGHAGAMDYLANSLEKRCDPSLVLEGTRSIVVVAAPYRPPRPDDVRGASTGRAGIAAYARGVDYHRVLERRLRKAKDALRTRLPHTFRYYVDSGPVLEKTWAERAGIGWIGKNTCVVHHENGSFFFLGVMLTTMDLEPDDPAVDQCGSCRACLDACPTDAFAEPYVLDARRCISYLTIEEDGEIPVEHEPKLGDLIFGCDICQQVCPYNREDEIPHDLELAPRPENIAPALDTLAALDDARFRERFWRSAVLRARFRGFLRNVIVAISNSDDPRRAALLGTLREREDLRTDAMLRETLKRACKRVEGGA